MEPTGQSCCVGITGNVDGDPQEVVDVGDLTALIGFLFLGNAEPQCLEEGNIDGDAGGVVDVGDLTALIGFLFLNGADPAQCASGGGGGPNIGDLIITEVMINPDVTADADGEWFEVFNTTNASISLNGLIVRDDSDQYQVTSAIDVGPGEFATFGRGQAVGFAPDVLYGITLFFNNANDILYLESNGVVIDSVSWNANWPTQAGRAIQLDPGSFDEAANDILTNWCPAVQSYNGDFGTPGQPNDNCQ